MERTIVGTFRLQWRACAEPISSLKNENRTGAILGAIWAGTFSDENNGISRCNGQVSDFFHPYDGL